MINDLPHGLKQLIKRAPNVVKLKDFYGFMGGKPMSRLMFKDMDGNHPKPRLNYVVDAECGYCGSINTLDDRRKYSSCPKCAGSWDEALVRGTHER